MSTAVSLYTVADLAKRANEEHRLAVAAMTSALEHAKGAGEALLAIKAQIPYGQWESWLKDDEIFEGSPRTARIYMRIARRWSEIEEKRQEVQERQRSAVFSIDAAIKFLASIDAEVEEPSEEALPPGGLVDRLALAKHLERLHLGGRVPEAWLEGRYTSAAFGLGANRSDLLFQGELLVVLPPFPGEVEPLPGRIGVTDLGLLIRALKAPREPVGSGQAAKVVCRSDQVVVGDQIGTLAVDLSTIISTELRDETRDKLCRVFDDLELCHLSESIIERFSYARRAMDANRAVITVGPDEPDGGGAIRLWRESNDSQHHGAKIKFHALHHERREVVVDAQALGAVFEQFKGDYHASLFAGDNLLGIQHFAGYRYVLPGFAMDG